MIGGRIKDSFKYHDYQIDAIKRMTTQNRTLMAFCTGAGKTLTFLGAFASAQHYGAGTRALIVSTGSSQVPIEDEINERTSFSYDIWEGGKKLPDTDIVIVSYGKLAKMFKSVESQINAGVFSHLICDEAHKLKSISTGVSKAFVAQSHKFRYSIFSTATLMSNDIMDIYGGFSALVPGMFGKEWDFKTKYCVLREKEFKVLCRKNGAQYKRSVRKKEIVSYKNLDVLKEMISPYILYHTVDYDIDFDTIEFDLSEGERTAYKIAAKGLESRKQNKGEVVHHSTRMHDLQLAVDIRPSGEMSNKMRTLSDWMDRNKEHGGVVYFSYRPSMSEAERFFSSKFLIRCINGDTKIPDRKSICRWMDKGKFIFMTQAGGESLDLNMTNRMCFFDIPFSILGISQVIGRITRVSSPFKKFFVTMLCARGTIDEYKAVMIQKNSHLVKSVLGGYSNIPGDGGFSFQNMTTLKRSLLWK